MSNLVNDLLIEPVLRRARQFSRSNIQRESIQCKETIKNCQNEVAVEELNEQPKCCAQPRIGSVGEPTPGTSTMDPAMTYSPKEEDKALENIIQARECVGSSVLSIPSRDELSTGMSELNSLGVELSNHTIADDSSTTDSNLFHENSVTSPRINTLARDHDVDSEDELMVSNQSYTHRSETAEESIRNPNYTRTSPLPEDDGMGKLRRQIQSIQAMDIRSEQKAILMHQLLNRKYLQGQKFSNTKNQGIRLTPSTIISQERCATPVSLTSFFWQINFSPETPTEKSNSFYHLSPDDLKQTYVPSKNQESGEPIESRTKDGSPILGCKHYQRNVKLQCSACDKWYTCRLCHDEVEDHILNRKATKNMLCMICGRAQKAGEYCIQCNERTAWYYCNVCKLWDNDPTKDIYHCNDCGICRKGLGIGKDFFHCKTCGTCMSMSVEHSHKCIERVSDSDCPICGEYMFTSPMPVVFMLCGHGIHKDCYNEHLKTSYKCPICNKSTVNMETQFRNLDRAIVSQPMPPQFRHTKAMVSCNDCCAKSVVKYHWLGFKCAICDSYNTSQLSLLSDSGVITNGQTTVDANLPIISDDRPGPSQILPETDSIRQRRHSTYIHPAGSNDRLLHRFFPIQRSPRTARSLSPTSRMRHFEEPLSQSSESDDSALEEEDALDFWGFDEPRSVSSGEILEDIEEDESDEDSGLEDCDEAEDEEDKFALFGHR